MVATPAVRHFLPLYLPSPHRAVSAHGPTPLCLSCSPSIPRTSSPQPLFTLSAQKCHLLLQAFYIFLSLPLPSLLLSSLTTSSYLPSFPCSPSFLSPASFLSTLLPLFFYLAPFHRAPPSLPTSLSPSFPPHSCPALCRQVKVRRESRQENG